MMFMKTRCALILLVLCMLGSESRADAIGFFYALDADLASLSEQTKLPKQVVKVGSRTVKRFDVGVHRIFAIKMESGVVETAVSTEALLARFHCDFAFSVGPIGSIDESLRIGQWCRVKSVVAYQKGIQAGDGFSPSDKASIQLDSEIDGLKLPESWLHLPTVKVASGELFIASDEFRRHLHDLSKAEGVDMNLFGLLSACLNHRVPLLCWRVVSDRADKNASADFQRFVSAYDGSGGRAIAEIIRSLPSNPNRPESYDNLREILSNRGEGGPSENSGK